MFEQGDEPVVRWKEVPRGRPSILMSPSTTPSSLRRARTSSRVWGEKQFRDWFLLQAEERATHSLSGSRGTHESSECSRLRVTLDFGKELTVASLDGNGVVEVLPGEDSR